MILGALEAGGTKMVCAIGNEKGEIFDQCSIPTTNPDETVAKVVEYFKDKEINALGIGSFGPIDLDRSSKSYGHILRSPKLAWNNYNFLGDLKELLNVPIGMDTDVNSSVLGEVTFGDSKSLDAVVYITIGTGIGIGVYVNGGLLHGMLHPEGGHILLNRHSSDRYKGACPFHKNCFEGLASGPAIEERWGKKAYELEQDKDVWELEAYYIAEAIVNYILILSPQRIILGGGVMHQEQLFPRIQSKVKELLNDYVTTKELEELSSYIVPASLKDNQGIMGCLKIALNELKGSIAMNKKL